MRFTRSSVRRAPRADSGSAAARDPGGERRQQRRQLLARAGIREVAVGPNMAQAVGLGAALQYLQKVGLSEIHSHEVDLTRQLLKGLQEEPGVQIIGPADLNMRGGVVSFTLAGIHPHDLGQYLDAQGIAVRTGHHCAWPLNRKLGVVATTRASLYLYNDEDDINALLAGVHDATKYFARA